jgi:hypothetical protein
MTPEQNDKLDEVLRRTATLFELLQGEHGQLGLLQKVEIMWRMHVWVLCSISAGLGGALTLMVRHFM